MEIYCLITYEYNTFSYDGIVEGDRFYFFNREGAESFAAERNLRIVNNCNYADREATIETVEVR